MYQIVHNFRHDEALRRSFNELAEATFGLNFENWYQNGFWSDCYDPYSLLVDGKIVANVSLNRTDLCIDGQVKRVYQLGTIMTAEEYRRRGYIRAIMEEINKDIPDGDGVYLFANDSVLDFYPKFGFQQGKEFVYSRTVEQTDQRTMENVPMNGPTDWAQLQKAMDENTFRSACHMEGNSGLIFFYVSQFMKDCIWFSKELNAWAIAEIEGDQLILHNIFCPHDISEDAVIAAFGPDIKGVTLGFSPADPTGYTCHALQEENTTFFVKGELFRDFENQKLRIPSLSHA